MMQVLSGNFSFTYAEEKSIPLSVVAVGLMASSKVTVCIGTNMGPIKEAEWFMICLVCGFAINTASKTIPSVAKDQNQFV